MRFRLCGVAMLLAIALPARAGVIYSTDGTSTPGFSASYGFGGSSAPSVAMQFVATTSGALSSVSVPLGLLGGDPTVVFEVLTDVAGAPGVVLDSLSFTIPSSTPTLLTASSTADPLLSAGTTYWLESEWTAQQVVLWFGTNPKVGGTAWSSTGGTQTGQEYLAAFALQGAQTPEPSPGVMLAIGALFFARLKRRRRFQVRPRRSPAIL
jgi:hypothetical protein